MIEPVPLDPAIREALARATLRAPASPGDVEVAVSAAARPLPADYVAFLRSSDGAEGWIGDNYVQIARARDAADTTTAFARFVPGLFFFAGDGAAGLFAFDLREHAGRVVITHTDGLNFEGLVCASESFTEFLLFLKREDWINFWGTERQRRNKGSMT